MTKIYGAWLFVGRVKDGQFFYQQTWVYILAEDIHEARDKAEEKLREKLVVEAGDLEVIKVEAVPEDWYTLKANLQELEANEQTTKYEEEFPELSVQVM